MNITLIRQDYEKPNFRELNAMREDLEKLISSDLDTPEFDWKALVSNIVPFQGEDGSFNLLNSYRIESDCRVYYCHEPTYICTALLMKALLLDKDILTGKEDIILPRAMHMCCARELQGHGIDALKGQITAVNYFLKCSVVEFLDRYPDMCSEFTAMFQSVEKCFADRVLHCNFSGDWGEDYEESIRSIHAAFSERNVFVYGTLLKGQCNHAAFLRDESFLGIGTLDGYDMYDLGSFPGIVRGKGKVYGEVYRVSAEELKHIDRLEGEGALYKKVPASIRMSDATEVNAAVYVYLNKVDGNTLLSGKYGGKKVWYVAYGSNLLEERLKYYIQGGLYPANGKEYPACKNTELPTSSCRVMIPYNMYYSNYAKGSWKTSAVCFLDFSRPGKAYGKAYLVTEEQMKHIHGQEGTGPNWYPEMIRLDDIDGIPAYTCGGYNEKKHEPFHNLSAEYGIVLYQGLRETYPELTETEIMAYLRGCGT